MEENQTPDPIVDSSLGSSTAVVTTTDISEALDVDLSNMDLSYSGEENLTPDPIVDSYLGSSTAVVNTTDISDALDVDLSKEASDKGLDIGISCKDKDCKFIVSGKLKRSKIEQRMQAHRNKYHPVGSSISNESTSKTLTPDPTKHHKINADTEIPDNTDVIASEETAVVITN